MLVHLGEVESRRLHLPAGYSSMFEYCVREFGWTRQTTFKRIGAARAARRFPVILPAVADGRLNLSGVILLRSHLTRANVAGLISAATHRTNAEIEVMLAERFPKRDVASRIVAASIPARELEAKPLIAFTSNDHHVQNAAAPEHASGGDQRSVRIVDSERPGSVSRSRTAEDPAPPVRLTPLAPERFALQVTIAGDTHALLRRAQELLSHQCIAGDVAQVLHRALEGLVRDLEKRKYAATEMPRAPRERAPKGRHIPAHVRRAVRERDGDQCTFIGENGHRCESRTRLEFDHVQPYSRGGESTVVGLRLRCRAHNQFDAERVFGSAFMAAKRAEARERSEARAVPAS